jgi:NADPH:quinone reductase-like Zn-dependent oxidoreductase
MSYKHVIVRKFGGPECLEVVEEPALPEPRPGEVRVKVLAAGTGFTDTIIRQGQYVGVKEKPPFTLGYDWFGVVDKLGEGVTGLAVGQHVADMPVIGGYTEYLTVDADRVVPAPQGLDPAEAVCMVLSYTTAYQMLTRIRDIPPGSKCLIHAAGGAVGTALLELGRLRGLEMYGTASAGKKALVESYGATHIDYRQEDFVARSLELSGGGLDVVLDTIGGRNWSRSYRCLKRGGILIAFGAMQITTGEEGVASVLAGFARLMLLWKLIPDGKSSVFYNIQKRREKLPEEFREDVQALFELLKAGKLKPAVVDRMPLEQAAEVHRLIDKAQVPGKIVLVNA